MLAESAPLVDLFDGRPPVWVRELSYRLVLLQRPDEPALMRETAEHLWVHRPGPGSRRSGPDEAGRRPGGRLSWDTMSMLRPEADRRHGDGDLEDVSTPTRAGCPEPRQRLTVIRRSRRAWDDATGSGARRHSSTISALKSDVNERRGRDFFFPRLSMMDTLSGQIP